jgi:hypothetical protein
MARTRSISDDPDLCRPPALCWIRGGDKAVTFATVCGGRRAGSADAGAALWQPRRRCSALRGRQSRPGPRWRSGPGPPSPSTGDKGRSGPAEGAGRCGCSADLPADLRSRPCAARPPPGGGTGRSGHGECGWAAGPEGKEAAALLFAAWQGQALWGRDRGQRVPAEGCGQAAYLIQVFQAQIRQIAQPASAPTIPAPIPASTTSAAQHDPPDERPKDTKRDGGRRVQIDLQDARGQKSDGNPHDQKPDERHGLPPPPARGTGSSRNMGAPFARIARAGREEPAAFSTSAAGIGRLPSRCASVTSTAPSPQAIVQSRPAQCPARPLPCGQTRAQELDPFAVHVGPMRRERATGRGSGGQPRPPGGSSRCAPRPCRSWRHRSRLLRAAAWRARGRRSSACTISRAPRARQPVMQLAPWFPRPRSAGFRAAGPARCPAPPPSA